MAPYVPAALGAAYAFSGRADEALSLVANAVEELHSRPWQSRPALILVSVGTGCFFAGRIAAAASHAREALEVARRVGARGDEARALCLLGDIASTAGEEGAESSYGEALALAYEL